MFKFNNGRGAVICDKCRIIIDENLGPDEYKKNYKKPVICWRCKEKSSLKKKEA